MKTDKILDTYISKHMNEDDTNVIRRRTLADIKIGEQLSQLDIVEVPEDDTPHFVVPTESPDWTDFKEKG